jgi:hypothetical protein
MAKVAARWIIGEKLRMRAATEPDALTATTLKMVDLLINGLLQIRKKHVPMFGLNILVARRPGAWGAK